MKAPRWLASGAANVGWNLLASLLFAGGQHVLAGMRGSEWERTLNAACKAAMKQAVQEASHGLSDEAVSEAAHAFNLALARLIDNKQLAADLGRNLLQDAAGELLRRHVETALGPDAGELARQGIDLDTVIRVFPQATLEELRGRLKPAAAPFLMMQLAEVNRRLGNVEERAALTQSVMSRIASVLELSGSVVDGATVEPRLSVDPEYDLSREILSTYASVLKAATPGELDNAAAQVQALVRKIRPSVYWQPLKSSDEIVVVDDVIQRILDQRPDLERLGMEQAWLRARTGRSLLALDDYARIAGRFGPSRSQALLEAATILMHIGDYAESIAMIRQARAEGLEPLAQIRAAHLSSWIDDYQGRHLDTIRASYDLLRSAQRLGERRHAYGIMHRLGRATLTLARKENDRALMDRALDQLRAAETYNYEENPFNLFWIARASIAVNTVDMKAVWQDAQERMAFLGDGGLAHIRLDQGRAALGEMRYTAALVSLHETEHAWKEQSYRKGLFDVAVALGEAYARLNKTTGDRRRAVIYMRLAERLATRLQLPHAGSVRQRLHQLLQHNRTKNRHSLRAVDERLTEMSFASVLSKPARSLLLTASVDVKDSLRDL